MQHSDHPVKKYKRSWKNILVNPAFQIRYTLWITVTGLAMVGIYSLLTYHYISENYSILVELSPMTDEAKAVLYSELRQILTRIALISCGFLVLVGWLGLIFSHRTAGPVFHFERVFREIAAGNFKARVRLRPRDEFQQTATVFNQMMDKVSEKIGTQ